MEEIKHPFINSTETHHAEPYTFTVEEMKHILENYNNLNRPMKKRAVKRIESDLQTNQWNPNTGNDIRIASTGDLIDGQHRVQAHVNQGLPYKTYVVSGLPPKAINFIGQRSSIRNPAESALLVETLRRPTKDEVKLKGKLLSVARLWMTLSGENSSPSPSDVQSFALRNSNIISKVFEVRDNPHSRKRLGYKAAIAMYLEKNEEKATEFINGVEGEGEELHSGSPILALRNYLSFGSSGGGQQTKKDYWTTVSMIHRFHFNEIVKKISEKRDWDF